MEFIKDFYILFQCICHHPRGDNFDDIPHLSDSGLKAKEIISGVNEYKLNDEIVSAIKTLWNEPAIRCMYGRRNITKIQDSSAYFWDDVDRFTNPHFLPTEEDILMVKSNTNKYVRCNIR